MNAVPGAIGEVGSNGQPAQGDTVAAMQLLDDPLEWSAFSRQLPSDQARWESNVLIEGMHCAACALTVEDALKSVPGVISADVSSGSQRARVVWQADQVQPSRWMQAVLQSGYRAVPANDSFARERRKVESRQALWRLMVAGLCMMQVMMYAYPAYVAEPGDLSAEMERLLRWASWVLSLPVILFSCGGFFSNAWRDVAHRRISMDLPVALGMLITFAVSTAGTFDPTGIFGREVYFDSLTMFVFFLLTGRWFELRLRDRTAGALETLMNRLPDGVERQKVTGEFELVAVRRLQLNDVVRILPGQTFPADGVVLSGQTSVDESLLTGESRPISRACGDEIIAGSHNLSSAVLVSIHRLGDDTRFAQIVRLMESAATSRPQLARLADQIARPFLLAVLIAAALACFYWWASDPQHALMVAVAVLVVTCPCALSLATPAAMLSAAGALARRGVLVRRLDAFEALAAVDTLIFDKTGTLTSDTLALGSVSCRSGIDSVQALAVAAAVAAYSLHPASRTLARAFALTGAHQPWQATDVTEHAGQGLRATLKPLSDAAPTLLVRLGSAKHCGLADEASNALRVFLADDSGWLATFELQEDIRPDALETVCQLKALGVSVWLLSGDTIPAAQRVAERVEIEAFEGLCSPADKLLRVREMQGRGHKVAMVGDGLNDGPVLAGANVSFAFGPAVPLAQAKADFIVPGQTLTNVVWAVKLARSTLKVVRQNLWWAAGYNAVAVPFAVLGWMPAWLAGIGMACSSLLVVANAARLARDNPMDRKM
ncbi:MAG: copper-translocating P-type ATPase [Comamonadaceae bacterium CG1_02_60_18]|nr:MAG: copper-translocating P-type ATPase [Comamonadaceae bacterium CG1_02_60_18]PIQ51900.1 MAG: copper-translocating P-type ATPase [Comamonadaceae bacterium CG12_big_fil_rev_8_21_14_0_65_59_15]